MAEWFKAAVLKTAVGASPPWVRIPPLPPVGLQKAIFSDVYSCDFRKLCDGLPLKDLTGVTNYGIDSLAMPSFGDLGDKAGLGQRRQHGVPEAARRPPV